MKSPLPCCEETGNIAILNVLAIKSEGCSGVVLESFTRCAWERAERSSFDQVSAETGCTGRFTREAASLLFLKGHGTYDG